MAKRAMQAAIEQGQAAARAEMKTDEMDEHAGEEAGGLAEEWAEDHEHAIESASDHAGDDLERIYDPVKDLARRTLDHAERESEKRRERLHRLLESGERVKLVQVPQPKELVS